MSNENRPPDDAIARAKRILEAVDTYHERPDGGNRHALRSMLIDEFQELLEARAAAPQSTKGDERAYAVYRTRPDENDGKEYFSVAHWHNDYIAQEGERILTGRFVPDRAAVPQAEQRMSDAEDAARYRWLRDNKHLDAWWSVSGPADRRTNIDADIDAARKGASE